MCSPSKKLKLLDSFDSTVSCSPPTEEENKLNLRNSSLEQRLSTDVASPISSGNELVDSPSAIMPLTEASFPLRTQSKNRARSVTRPKSQKSVFSEYLDSGLWKTFHTS